MGHPPDDDARFGELVRAADPQPPTSAPPPPYELWAAGAARRTARHRRRVSLTAAAAVVVLVVLSVPVLQAVTDESHPGPSELTTTGADDEGLPAVPSTTTAPPGARHVTDPTVLPPEPSVPPDAPIAEQPGVDPAVPSPGDVPPIPTTTIVPADAQGRMSDGQSRMGNDQGRTQPGVKPPYTMDLPALRQAARAEFGARYGGVTGLDGVYTVHVTPGAEALPATFQGYPVIAAVHSWTELEGTLAAIQSRHEELTASGIPVLAYSLDDQDLLVAIVVSPLDDSMEATVRAILGDGPWHLRDNTGGT